MKDYKIALVGATGLVGRKVIEVLEEYNISTKNLRLFASERSAGQELFVNNRKITVELLDENTFLEHFDYAIFSAGGEVSKKYAPIATQNGCIVIDNSSAFRMNPDVPLVVPEVNPEEAFNNNRNNC